MHSIIRRRRKNYHLPSECSAIFSSLLGKPIIGLKFGAKKAPEAGAIAMRAPFFLAVDSEACIVFYEDDFLESIVVRVVERGIDDPLMLDELERDDGMGPWGRPQALVDAAQKQIEGRQICAISVYKLPNNFYSKPIGYDTVNESVIEFVMDNDEKLLFASHIAGDGYADLRISRWDSLDPSAVKDLSCILRVEN